MADSSLEINLKEILNINAEIKNAIQTRQPVVALESAVITHGLPNPKNIELAKDMETEIKNQGAIPATTAFFNGKLQIGLSEKQLNELANHQDAHKISRRDFGLASANGWYGGTTVAGTLIASKLAGIKVFATGGIGGVHRGNIYDVSADLQELSKSPVVVVCAGAKSILNLPATLEVLETLGIPVIGYQTDQFPAFYAKESGLKTHYKAETAAEIANIYQQQQNFKLNTGILVVNPIPDKYAIPNEEMEVVIQKAIIEAEENGVIGSAITPFLLGKIATVTKGKSLAANLALLKNNARLAAKISIAISQLEKKLQFV